MSLLPDEPEDGPDSNPYVHSAGPAILLPADAIGNIVSRTNKLISDHREWLANLPLQNKKDKRQIVAVRQATVENTYVDVVTNATAATCPATITDSIGTTNTTLYGTYAKVARAARDLAREKGYRLHRAAVLQAGRMHWVAVYLDPEKPVRAEDIDTFRDILSARLEDVIGPARVEIVLTASDYTNPVQE